MSASTTYSDSPTPQPQPSQYSYQSFSDVPQQPPQTSQSTTAVAAPAHPQTRQAAEEARKDRTLAEFLLMLDEYEPLVCPALIPSPSSQPVVITDPQRGHRLLSPESWVRMRRCPHVSRSVLVCVLVSHFFKGNAFFPLLPRNSSPTLPLMHTSMLVYVRMRQVGGLARLSRALEPPRFVFTNPAPIDEVLTCPKDKTRTTLTMDDLSAALAEYGINARKPEFYI